MLPFEKPQWSLVGSKTAQAPGAGIIGIILIEIASVYLFTHDLLFLTLRAPIVDLEGLVFLSERNPITLSSHI